MEPTSYYKHLNDAELIVSADSMYTALITNDDYLKLWPSVGSTLAKLKEATEVFRVAYNAAKTKDTVKINWRNVKRVELHAEMENTAQFVVATTRDTPDVLIGTGIELRKKRGPSAHVTPQDPVVFTVENGKIRGTMIAKISKPAGAVSVEVFVSEVEPSLEQGWVFKASHLSGSQMEMTGFQSGKQYHFRARGIGSGGTGPWSAVISLICL